MRRGLRMTKQGTKESEKSTEAYLYMRMRQIGGQGNKYICPSHNGKPDRVCEFPNGLVAWVEVKSEGKRPEAHQLREHDRMRGRGQIVEVLDTKAKVDAFIDLYKEIDNAIQLHECIDRSRTEIRNGGSSSPK